jgi:hypothetical protein
MVAFDQRVILPNATQLCVYALSLALAVLGISIFFLSCVLLKQNYTRPLVQCTCRRPEEKKAQ